VLVVVVLVLVVPVDPSSAVLADDPATGGQSSVAVSEPVAQLLSAAASTAAPQAEHTRAACPPDPLIVPACRPSALRLAR
jgi:hypothetical protein